MDPVKLMKIIRNQVGEVKFARVLNDGNLLIGSSSEGQIERVQKLQVVGKVRVTKMVRVGEKKVGCKGMIYGVPLTVDMKELVANLKVNREAVKSAK